MGKEQRKQTEFRPVTVSDVRRNLGTPDEKIKKARKYATYWDVALATYPELKGKTPDELEKLRPRYEAVVRNHAETFARWLTTAYHDTESTDFAEDAREIRKLHGPNYSLPNSEMAKKVLREEDRTRVTPLQSDAGSTVVYESYDLSGILKTEADNELPVIGSGKRRNRTPDDLDRPMVNQHSGITPSRR